MKVTVSAVVIGVGYIHQKIGTGTGDLEIKRTCRDHPNSSIIKIDQNTEKSSGDLRRLAVTPIPGKSHRLTLV